MKMYNTLKREKEDFIPFFQERDDMGHLIKNVNSY